MYSRIKPQSCKALERGLFFVRVFLAKGLFQYSQHPLTSYQNRNDMSQYTIYLDLEPYLAQWFIHEQGGEHPVTLTRGSAESDILEL